MTLAEPPGPASPTEPDQDAASDANARAELLLHQVKDLTARLHAVETSTSWRASAALRHLLRGHPFLARTARRAARLAWWIVTLRLHQKLREYLQLRKYRRARRGVAPFAAPTQAPDDPPPAWDTAQARAAARFWFDGWYYAHQPGAQDSDDFAHFMNSGAAAGRLPSTLVAYIMQRFAPDTRFTPEIYAALAEASADWPKDITPKAVLLLAALYVPQWHAGTAPALDRFLAYLRAGMPASISPGPLFDATIYRRRAAAAALPRIRPDASPMLHWLEHGVPAYIVPTTRYDEAFYRRTNPDIDSAPIWGFAHFIEHGVYEGRLPTKLRPGLRQGSSSPSGNFGLSMPLSRWYAIDFPKTADNAAGASPQDAHVAQAFAALQSTNSDIDAFITQSQLPKVPQHDVMATIFAELRGRLRAPRYDTIICVPWLRVGGADLVAGLLARALLRVRPDDLILILRTDNPHFERANWLPEQADCVDMSDLKARLTEPQAENLLRAAFRGTGAKRVFNVNSRLCWLALRDHGATLAATLHTYSYLFCWDQTPTGRRAGYPAEFFATTIGSIAALLTDTTYMRDELMRLYRLTPDMKERIVPIFTPAQTPLRPRAMAREVAENANPTSRKLVLWAGRLDRQKRFDLVQDIARAMPDVEFRCWGAALLDAPPDMKAVPGNIHMQGSFDSFDDLPLHQAGAWLFTALWEGMPTTIIELATRGVTMVASAVGGVPELIRPDTGWPVAEDASVADYVATLCAALDNPDEAACRAEALQRRVAAIYTEQLYDRSLRHILDAEDAT